MTPPREVVEGWAPAWPLPTTIVWMAVPAAGVREAIVVFSELEFSGQPAEVAREVRMMRQRYKMSADRLRSVTAPSAAGSARDWPREYARAGIWLGPTLGGHTPEIRSQRLARELDRRVAKADGKVIPGLLIHPNAARVAAALRSGRAGEDQPPIITALCYALMAVPEDRLPVSAAESADALGRRLYPHIGSNLDARDLAPAPTPEEVALYGITV